MKSLRLILLALTCSLVAPLFAGTYKYHPSITLHLGSSFNPLQPDQVFPNCITYDQVVSLEGKGSINTDYSSSLVNSREELYRHLNLDAALSASFLFGSGSASFSLDEEYHFGSRDLVWVVKGVSDYGRYAIVGARLTAAAAALRSNPVTFARRCGYEFVGQEHRAVQVAAVYSLHDLTETEKSRMTAALEGGASWSGGKFEVKGKTDNFKKAAREVSQVHVNIFAIGGGGLKLLASITGNEDIAEIQPKIKTYVESMGPEAAAPIEYVTGSWRSFGVDLDPAALEQQTLVLSEVYFSYRQYEPLLRQTGALIRESAAPGTWLTEDQAVQLNRDYLAIANVLEQLREVAHSCLDNADSNAKRWRRQGRALTNQLRMASLLEEKMLPSSTEIDAAANYRANANFMREHKVDDLQQYNSKPNIFLSVFADMDEEFAKKLENLKKSQHSCELRVPPRLKVVLPSPPKKPPKYKDALQECNVPRNDWVPEDHPSHPGEPVTVGITCELPGDYIPRPGRPSAPKVEEQNWQEHACAWATRVPDLDVGLSANRVKLGARTNSSDACTARFKIHYLQCIENCSTDSTQQRSASQRPGWTEVSAAVLDTVMWIVKLTQTW
jgi:hypothetical protein